MTIKCKSKVTNTCYSGSIMINGKPLKKVGSANLNKLKKAYPKNIIYNPTNKKTVTKKGKFTGAIIKINGLNSTATLFTSGKYIIVGVKKETEAVKMKKELLSMIIKSKCLELTKVKK